jgi:hypothetical protein
MIIDGTNGLTFNNATTQASAGQVLQVVNATYSTATSTTSENYVTTGLTASITPKFSTSKILAFISIAQYATVDTDQSGGSFGLYRGASEIANLGGNVGYIINTTTTIIPLFFQYLDSPATTSSTTYTLYFSRGSGGTVTVQRDNSPSRMTLMEISV